MSLLSKPGMGCVAKLPSLDMRTQVPSPWLTPSTNRVVKTVCAVDRRAKAVARPSVKRIGECIFGLRSHKPALKNEWYPKKDSVVSFRNEETVAHQGGICFVS
jgi:hypothetical protein